jgi:hypothetical protein
MDVSWLWGDAESPAMVRAVGVEGHSLNSMEQRTFQTMDIRISLTLSNPKPALDKAASIQN